MIRSEISCLMFICYSIRISNIDIIVRCNVSIIIIVVDYVCWVFKCVVMFVG